MIQQMDTGQPLAQVPVQTITMINADPLPVAQTLARIFGPVPGGRGQASRPSALIEADRASHLIMVRTDKDTFERIKDMAAKLDTAPTGSQTKLVVIPLKNAYSWWMATVINRGFRDRQGGARRCPMRSVTAVAEPVSNTLVVNATEANLVKIRGMVDELDKQAAAGSKTETLVLKNAKAPDLSNMLRLGIAPPPTPGKPGVTISADAPSNTLLISGPAEQVAKVLELAKQLEAGTPAGAPATRSTRHRPEERPVLTTSPRQ